MAVASTLKLVALVFGAFMFLRAAHRRIVHSRHGGHPLDSKLTRALRALAVAGGAGIVCFGVGFLPLMYGWPRWIGMVADGISAVLFVACLFLAGFAGWRIASEEVEGLSSRLRQRERGSAREP